MESEEEHPLVWDPLAKHMAGSSAVDYMRRRAAAAPAGTERSYKVAKLAIRTRWFDDQIEAALGMPVAGRFRQLPRLCCHLPGPVPHAATGFLQRLHARPPTRLRRWPCIAQPLPALFHAPAGIIPATLRDPGGPPQVDLSSYVWTHPDGHEPRQLVMLGAGMDSRPWRMKLPAGVVQAAGSAAVACPACLPCLPARPPACSSMHSTHVTFGPALPQPFCSPAWCLLWQRAHVHAHGSSALTCSSTIPCVVWLLVRSGRFAAAMHPLVRGLW